MSIRTSVYLSTKNIHNLQHKQQQRPFNRKLIKIPYEIIEPHTQLSLQKNDKTAF